MQSFAKTSSHVATLALLAAGGVAFLSSHVFADPAAAPAARQFTVAQTATAAAAVAALKPQAAPVVALVQAAAPVLAVNVSETSLRAKMKFDTVKWAGKPVQTLNEESRLLLAQAAAHKAGLHEVGLSYHDVYGVIEAETSWIPRTGASKDGTPNLGLAQFEPRTARGLGVSDPSDPVQAVFGAAMYMKEGAQWATKRVAALELSPEERALKVREGVSIYYNLSIKGRNKWDGMNTTALPIETQRHISNARAGAAEAAQLAKLLRT